MASNEGDSNGAMTEQKFSVDDVDIEWINRGCLSSIPEHTTSDYVKIVYLGARGSFIIRIQRLFLQPSFFSPVAASIWSLQIDLIAPRNDIVVAKAYTIRWYTVCIASRQGAICVLL